ncbi:uncharacterized protein LOC130657274 [Hydractinia symbiolongicarpus]|uniref:uncharacterized protein LOC130657274 n=1 Tax=Hydractinia symbiolongicarpus TaxID=13093 RepID=UPI00254DFED0|nr:uncharacterized protein LOC130657274 [Hydractinia symbiolongicarpus]XP_057316236.1 uncharacterized protein LOC130657274 [Hydractinia symbiolongicarpus]
MPRSFKKNSVRRVHSSENQYVAFPQHVGRHCSSQDSIHDVLIDSSLEQYSRNVEFLHGKLSSSGERNLAQSQQCRYRNQGVICDTKELPLHENNTPQRKIEISSRHEPPLKPFAQLPAEKNSVAVDPRLKKSFARNAALLKEKMARLSKLKETDDHKALISSLGNNIQKSNKNTLLVTANPSSKAEAVKSVFLSSDDQENVLPPKKLLTKPTKFQNSNEKLLHPVGIHEHAGSHHKSSSKSSDERNISYERQNKRFKSKRVKRSLAGEESCCGNPVFSFASIDLTRDNKENTSEQDEVYGSCVNELKFHKDFCVKQNNQTSMAECSSGGHVPSYLGKAHIDLHQTEGYQSSMAGVLQLNFGFNGRGDIFGNNGEHVSIIDDCRGQNVIQGKSSFNSKETMQDDLRSFILPVTSSQIHGNFEREFVNQDKIEANNSVHTSTEGVGFKSLVRRQSGSSLREISNTSLECDKENFKSFILSSDNDSTFESEEYNSSTDSVLMEIRKIRYDIKTNKKYCNTNTAHIDITRRNYQQEQICGNDDGSKLLEEKSSMDIKEAGCATTSELFPTGLPDWSFQRRKRCKQASISHSPKRRCKGLEHNEDRLLLKKSSTFEHSKVSPLGISCNEKQNKHSRTEIANHSECPADLDLEKSEALSLDSQRHRSMYDSTINKNELYFRCDRRGGASSQKGVGESLKFVRSRKSCNTEIVELLDSDDGETHVGNVDLTEQDDDDSSVVSCLVENDDLTLKANSNGFSSVPLPKFSTFEQLGRKWIKRNQPDEIKNNILLHFQFTIVSYAILTDSSLRTNLSRYKKRTAEKQEWVLDWEYRRENLLHELLFSGADILCLQEVEKEHFETWFKPKLSLFGYDAIFTKRHDTLDDGCATFYKMDAFQLITTCSISYYNQVNVASLNKNNVGLIIVLQPLKQPLTNTSPICITNTYFASHKFSNQARILQSAMLFAEIDRMAQSQLYEYASRDSPYIPTIICGDFNFKPFDSNYDFFVNGRLDFLPANLKCLFHNKPRSASSSPNLNINKNCCFLAYNTTGTNRILHGSENLKTPGTGTEIKKNKRRSSTTKSKPINLDENNNTILAPISEFTIEEGEFEQLSDFKSQDSATESNTDSSVVCVTPTKQVEPANHLSLCHSLILKSAYRHYNVDRDKEVTSFSEDGFVNVDYIFYTPSQERLWMAGVLELPSVNTTQEALPNQNLSSDHFLLLTSFILR